MRTTKIHLPREYVSSPYYNHTPQEMSAIRMEQQTGKGSRSSDLNNFYPQGTGENSMHDTGKDLPLAETSSLERFCEKYGRVCNTCTYYECSNRRRGA